MNVDTSDAKVIEVYSEQFKWTARSSGADNELGSSNFKLVTADNALGVNMEDQYSLDDKLLREVHLVVGEPVVLKFRSRDVIHSCLLYTSPSPRD